MGRVLVASLHQSIADLLPSRLGFYENWLSARGLREGSIGLAPLLAVLSFLRQEGEAYQLITRRAGEYAAEWTVQAMPGMRRRIVQAMPVWARRRLVLRLARRVVHDTYRGSRAVSRVGKATASLDLRPSIFCTVREPVGRPLCGYYAAAVARLFALFQIDGRADVVSCRGAGESTCRLQVVLPRRAAVPGAPPAVNP